MPDIEFKEPKTISIVYGDDNHGYIKFNVVKIKFTPALYVFSTHNGNLSMSEHTLENLTKIEVL